MSELKILREGSRYIVGLHQSNGDVSYVASAAASMPPDWGVAVISSRWIPFAVVPQSLDDLATRYRKTMAAVLRNAPVVLGGWGLGGLMALACASSTATSQPLLGMFAIETKIPEPAWADRPNDLDKLSRGLLDHRAKWVGKEPPATRAEDTPEERLRNGLAALGVTASVGEATHELHLFQKHVKGIQTFRARPVTLPCMLYMGEGATHDLGWGAIAPHATQRSLPGDHFTICSPAHAANIVTAATDLVATLT